MKRILDIFIICCLSFQFAYGQNFGDLPRIKKEKLLNDLEILYQGLDKFHLGMYWYTPKDSVDRAFADVRRKITKDLNVLEFHKLIATTGKWISLKLSLRVLKSPQSSNP